MWHVTQQIEDMADVQIDMLQANGSLIGSLQLSDNTDFPLAISMSLADMRDITKRSGTYSKTFTVPASQHNNRLMGHIYRATVDANTTRMLVPARISVDGLVLFYGKLSVKQSGQRIDPTEYELEFVGDNLDWVDYFKDHSIRDLEYNHPAITSNTLRFGGTDPIPVIRGNGLSTLTSKVIEASWTGSYDTGWDIVYSLKNYGQWSDPDAVVQPVEMRPDIYIKSIIEKAYTAAGYRVDSSFLDSAAFKKVILPFTGKGFVSQAKHLDTLGWKLKKTQTTQANSLSYMYYETEEFDRAAQVWEELALDAFGNMVPVTLFKVSQTGNYNLHFHAIVQSNTSNPDASQVYAHEVTIHQVQRSGQTIGNTGVSQTAVLGHIPRINTVRLLDKTIKVSLETGKMYAIMHAPGGPATHDLRGGSTVECRPSDEFLGQPFQEGTVFDISEQLPDIKLIDILTGLMNLFNLYIKTDTRLKRVYIEPRKDFYKGRSEAVDWSGKLDMSKTASISFLDSYKRTLQFSFKDDGKDSLAKAWKTENDALPGSLEYDLPERYTPGEQKLGNKTFAYTILKADNIVKRSGYAAPYLPHFWSGEGEPPEPSFDFAPRILTYEGLQTQPYNNQVAGWAWRNAGDIMNKVPEATNGGSLKLRYHTSDGLVATQYQYELSHLYEGKLITAYFYLKPSDMLTVDMTRPIYLNDQNLAGYYYINKIVDYQPTKVATTKVELIRAFPLPVPDFDTGNNVDYTTQKRTAGSGTGTGRVRRVEDLKKLTDGVASAVLQNGSNNWAVKDAGSVAWGQGAVAAGGGQHVYGNFNALSDDDVFQVGAGTGAADRYRGLTFTADGNFLVQGGYLYNQAGQPVLFGSQKDQQGRITRFDNVHLKGNK